MEEYNNLPHQEHEYNILIVSECFLFHKQYESGKIS